jgi:hypothetical protein
MSRHDAIWQIGSSLGLNIVWAAIKAVNRAPPFLLAFNSPILHEVSDYSDELVRRLGFYEKKISFPVVCRGSRLPVSVVRYSFGRAAPE